MKLANLYFLVAASWMPCALGENTRGATKFTTRSLTAANATIVDEVVMNETTVTTAAAEPEVKVVAAKHHHDYSSKDFEYVSTRPSSKGSKKSGSGHSSGKGGSGKGSSSSKGSHSMSGKGGKGGRGHRNGGSGRDSGSGSGGKKKDSKTIISKLQKTKCVCKAFNSIHIISPTLSDTFHQLHNLPLWMLLLLPHPIDQLQ